MRKIGIRQFQQNFHKELKDLPFIVTKDGEDYCDITPSRKKGTTGYHDVTEFYKDDSQSTIPIEAFQNYPLVRTSGGKLTNIGIDLAGGGSKDKTVVIGKCEVSNTNCKGVGNGYRVTFMTDEGEKKKEVIFV